MVNQSKARQQRFWKKWEKSGAVNNQSTEAYVTKKNGQLIMVDPIGYTFLQTVKKKNCESTLQLNKDRVEHFKQRMVALEKTPKEVVIVIVNVDDDHGGPIADMLMPGFNWQEIRDRNEIPFARGLVQRDHMYDIVKIFDKAAARKFWKLKGTLTVVVDHDVAEVFAA